MFTPLRRAVDQRGWFVKVFQASQVAGAGGERGVDEVYLSSSTKGTIRGLHFQVPPHDHAKTVACIEGLILDVVLDLRVGSPTEGRTACFRLDAWAPGQLHLPPGVAHGFQALEDDTVVAYVVSSEHAPDHDQGIRWDSVDVTWPINPPILSPRDRSFPTYEDFDSPFRY